MKSRHLLMITMASLVAAAATGAQTPAGRGQASAGGRGGPTAAINWNLIMFPSQRFADRDKEQKDPVRLFDNVYSVGDQTVCSFLITTSGGLVVIDTTFPETVDLVIENIRKLGFDPANIKFVFPTHAASDHFGGAGRIKQVAPGARIGTSLEDWQSIEEQLSRPQPPGSKLVPFSRDLVITDGQTLTLGETTFRFYVLPGQASRFVHGAAD